MTKLGLFVALAAGLGLLLAGWTARGWLADRDQARAVAAAETKAREAAEAILEKERAAREKADELEVAYHDQAKNINLLAADNRRLADELGGLRDPYAGAGCRNQGGSAGNTQNGPASGQLSREASEFLLGLAREADEMSAYAWTCYFWINRNAPGALDQPPLPAAISAAK